MDKLNRVGEKYITNEGYEVEIVEYFNSKNCTIKFKNGLILTNREFGKIKLGIVKNPYHRRKLNIGYIGEGKYKCRINKIYTRNYQRWAGILERCYNEKDRSRYPTYKDVTVCKEWHNFQVFAEWFEENWKPWMDSSWHLDKDILVKGNKIYSPETCCFVPQEINNLFVNNKSRRGLYPIGVSLINETGRFSAGIRINSISINLNSFNTPEEAFYVYKIDKESHIKEVANKWKPFISTECCQAMYNYKIEITD